jgi:hypothetical protein
MGAHFSTLRFSGSDSREKIRRDFHDQQECDRSEHGSSYSGAWNMATGLVFEDRSFASEEEAEAYLEDRAQKWEDAIAVRVPRMTKPSAAVQALQKRIDELHSEHWRLPDEIAARMRAQKAKLRTCVACSSRVAVSFIRAPACPVCRSERFGWTDTDLKRKARIQASIADLKTKIAAAKARDAKGESDWIAGAWLAS